MILLNYGVGWQSRSFIAGLLQFLAKNMALLHKNFGENFLFQDPFSVILRLRLRDFKTKTKKFWWPLSSRDGGYGALVVKSTKN